MKKNVSKMLLLVSVFAVLMNFNVPTFSAFESFDDNVVSCCEAPDPMTKK